MFNRCKTCSLERDSRASVRYDAMRYDAMRERAASRGLRPVQRLNAREKAAGSEKPVRYAT
jgi:hypothetical protein